MPLSGTGERAAGRRWRRGVSARCLATIGALASVVVVTSAARADPVKDQCVASYEHGQTLRQAGKLREARAELSICSRDECPDLAKNDCVRWLSEVVLTTPSLVVSARTPAGADVADARVRFDDRVLLDRLTGKPVDVDPGEHQLCVDAVGFEPTCQRIVVNLGEKDRLVRVVLGRAAAAPAPSAPPSPVPSNPPSPSRPFPWASGAIAIGGLAIGGGLEAGTLIRLHDLHATCAPMCSPGAVTADRVTMAVGDVLIGVGLIATAVTIWRVVREPSRDVTSAARRVERSSFAPGSMTRLDF